MITALAACHRNGRVHSQPIAPAVSAAACGGEDLVQRRTNLTRLQSHYETLSFLDFLCLIFPSAHVVHSPVILAKQTSMPAQDAKARTRTSLTKATFPVFGDVSILNRKGAATETVRTRHVSCFVAVCSQVVDFVNKACAALRCDCWIAIKRTHPVAMKRISLDCPRVPTYATSLTAPDGIMKSSKTRGGGMCPLCSAAKHLTTAATAVLVLLRLWQYFFVPINQGKGERLARGKRQG